MYIAQVLNTLFFTKCSYSPTSRRKIEVYTARQSERYSGRLHIYSSCRPPIVGCSFARWLCVCDIIYFPRAIRIVGHSVARLCGTNVLLVVLFAPSGGPLHAFVVWHVAWVCRLAELCTKSVGRRESRQRSYSQRRRWRTRPFWRSWTASWWREKCRTCFLRCARSDYY